MQNLMGESLLREELNKEEDEEVIKYEFRDSQGKEVRFLNLKPHRHLRVMEEAIRLVYQADEDSYEDYSLTLRRFTSLTHIVRAFCFQILSRNSR